MSGAKLCVSINQSLTPNIPSSVLLESMVTVMERERERKETKNYSSEAALFDRPMAMRKPT
jgi:hypothetical protein